MRTRIRRTVKLKRPRDSQRGKVYAAEEAMKKESPPFPDGIDGASGFVRDVMNNARIKKLYGNMIAAGGPIRVRTTRRDSHRSFGNENGMALHPEWGLTPLVVSHELAHVFTRRIYGYYGAAAHGPEYCAIYLDIVQAGISGLARTLLAAHFKAHKVRYRVRQKRTYTPEQKERLKAQLARGRATAAARAYARELQGT